MTPSPSAKKRNAYYRGPEPMTAALQTPVVFCPKCAGPVWDQKGSKFWGTGLFKSGKQKPRWECKNKECGGAVWEKAASVANVPTQDLPPFLQDAAAQDAAELAGKIGPPDKPKMRDAYKSLAEWVFKEIAPIYEEHYQGPAFIPEVASACIQTLFIQACKSGKVE